MSLLEELGSIEHERWSAWMRHMFTKGTFNADGTFTIAAPSVERWQRQLSTPYNMLSEIEKESDRIEARKALAAIDAFALKHI